MPISRFLRILALIALPILYCLLFYLQYHHKILIDFSSMYFAAESLSKGINPYQLLSTSFLPVQKKLPVNLNPPCLLWFFQVFVPLGYKKAFIVWTCLSMLASLKVCSVSFQLLRQNHSFNLKKIDFFLIYFSTYPVFMNTIVTQFGFFLAFFILLGYQFLQRQKPLVAGFLWGLIAAVKLFPLLLLIYAFLNKQKQLFLIMLITFIAASLIPLLFLTPAIYSAHYAILQKALWYGDNWNASFYGFLFRLFADPVHASLKDLLYIKLSFVFIFILCFGLYWIKVKEFVSQSHQLAAFNLTLAMMLFLSPLGWLYYFPMLILPAFTLWSALQSGATKYGVTYFIATYFALIFLCSPIIYIMSLYMPQSATQSTLFSVHFYGLLLLIIGLYFPPQKTRTSYSTKDLSILNNMLILILLWGVLVITYYLIRTLFFSLT